MIKTGTIIENPINQKKEPMAISNFPATTIGWVVIITGVSAILAVIFLALMATVNMSFGKINGIFNAIIGISSVVLAWMLYAEHYAKFNCCPTLCVHLRFSYPLNIISL